MKSSQNIILQEFTRLIIKTRLDHPREYSEDWEGANKWIYISNETSAKWRRLREEQSLPSDDSKACYLPILYVNHGS